MMKTCWLLYDPADYAVNRDFAVFFAQKGLEQGLEVQTVLTSQLSIGIAGTGSPVVQAQAHDELPSLVVSRQRNALISRQFEALGIPVFNNAKVCELCNDKRRTHQFLAGKGIPMPESSFGTPVLAQPAADLFPLVLKPACSHGGDRVQLVRDVEEWNSAARGIAPEAMLRQRPVSDAGRDLRVYVLFGEIVAGVMRTAREGLVSNYKMGGSVALHGLTQEEAVLAGRVIAEFQKAGAPLCFAGVDLLYHEGRPVLSEVEDVVGSRMLYHVNGPDVVEMYVRELTRRA